MPIRARVPTDITAANELAGSIQFPDITGAINSVLEQYVALAIAIEVACSLGDPIFAGVPTDIAISNERTDPIRLLYITGAIAGVLQKYVALSITIKICADFWFNNVGDSDRDGFRSRQ